MTTPTSDAATPPSEPMLRIPKSAHPVPTTSRHRNRRVPLIAYVLGTLAIIAVVIMGAQSLNWFQAGAKVDAATGERVAPAAGATTSEIKGWMTIQQVLDAYPVSKDALYAEFGIPADTPTSTGLGELKESGDSTLEIPALRDWIDAAGK